MTQMKKNCTTGSGHAHTYTMAMLSIFKGAQPSLIYTVHCNVWNTSTYIGYWVSGCHQYIR